MHGQKFHRYNPTRLTTPLEVYSCPSRRPAGLYPSKVALGAWGGSGAGSNWKVYYNSDLPDLIARTDYAGCGGIDTSGGYGPIGPPTLADGDALTPTQWLTVYKVVNTNDTGVIFGRSVVKMIDITDGASNTYLAGERNCDPDCYFNGESGADTESHEQGVCGDVVRWTSVGDSSLINGYTGQVAVSSHTFFPPYQDTPGYASGYCFGSARCS